MNFVWDESNARKIRRHNISSDEVEEAMFNDPVFMYPQQAEDEERELYYSETKGGRLLAVAVAWISDDVARVITAYDLDAGQIQCYYQRRMEERYDRT